MSFVDVIILLSILALVGCVIWAFIKASKKAAKPVNTNQGGGTSQSGGGGGCDNPLDLQPHVGPVDPHNPSHKDNYPHEDSTQDEYPGKLV